jgi:hypothetical protein
MHGEEIHKTAFQTLGGVRRHAVRFVESVNYVRADDERHLARLFTQVCNCRPRRHLCLVAR